MLVITRKKNESIVINDEIEILILESEPNRVKIGIQAPKSMKIMRKEIIEAVRNENQAASHSDINNLKQLLNKDEMR